MSCTTGHVDVVQRKLGGRLMNVLPIGSRRVGQDLGGPSKVWGPLNSGYESVTSRTVTVCR